MYRSGSGKDPDLHAGSGVRETSPLFLVICFGLNFAICKMGLQSKETGHLPHQLI